MNDFEIVVKQQYGVISTNFEEIKAALSEQMKIYSELTVTEANKVERKKDVATLRKMLKALKDKESEVKKECLSPYEGYRELSRELECIINEPIGIIDNQVKEFEEKQRITKIAAIKDLFNTVIADYPTLIDEIGQAEIYDSRWENTTASMKSVKDEMISKLNTIRDNVALIESMVSDKKEEALDMFWGDLDIAKAINMINRYEAQKREIEQRMIEQQRKEKEAEEERQRTAKERELERERQKVREEEMARIRKEEEIREEERRKARLEEERIREEERIATEERLMSIKPPINREEDLEAPFIMEGDETPFIVSFCAKSIFKVIGTTEEMQQIEMYMNSIGVLFEREDM